MATTGSGLPKPVGTDKLRDGDNAIAALADAIDVQNWQSTAPKRRHWAGWYSTGTDGRVWIPVAGITNPGGAVGSIIGTAKWLCRPYQFSTGSVLWEVHDLAGNTINSTAMTFSLSVWGS